MSPAEYILDNRFAVHLMAVHDIEWPAPKIVLPEEIPDFLKQYPADKTVCCSHNFLFDGAILAYRYGWVPDEIPRELALQGFDGVRAYADPGPSRTFLEETLGFDPHGDSVWEVRGDKLVMRGKP